MRWWNDLKIGKKLLVGFGIVIILGTGGVFSASRALQHYVQAVNTTGSLCQQAVVTAQDASLASSESAKETMEYVYTAEQQHWDAKMKANDAARKAFEKVKAILQKLPDNKRLLDSLQAASIQDEKNCNPLADQTMELAKAGKLTKARHFSSTQYVPARTQLDALIHQFTEETKKYAQALTDSNAASAGMAVNLAWGCQIFIIVLSIAQCLFLMRAITQPIQQISDRLQTLQNVCLTSLGLAVEALAKGDLTATVETHIEPLTVDRKDEFGQMAQTFNAMLTRTKSTVESFVSAQASLRELIGEVASSTELLTSTSVHLSSSAVHTGAAAREISQTIQGVANAAGQSATTSQEMAKASEQQAGSATDAAAAMERLQTAVVQVQAGGRHLKQASHQADEGMQQAAQAVEQVASSALHMANTARQAAAVAQSGGTAVELTMASMARIQEHVRASSEKVQELGEKSKSIGAIVETIDQIAGQTNLLALNAAIEAARAGEQGRGFAVVADEVRKLAERATQATKEIAGLIGNVRAGVGEAVSAMQMTRDEVQQGATRSEEAGSALLQILEAAQSVASEVQAVTATAEEMSASVQSVRASVLSVRQVSDETEKLVSGMAVGAQQVAEAITSVASLSEETAAGAEEMSAVAKELSASAQNVSTAVEEQTASIEEINGAAGELNDMAVRLQETVSLFKLDETDRVKTRLTLVPDRGRRAA